MRKRWILEPLPPPRFRWVGLDACASGRNCMKFFDTCKHFLYGLRWVWVSAQTNRAVSSKSTRELERGKRVAKYSIQGDSSSYDFMIIRARRKREQWIRAISWYARMYRANSATYIPPVIASSITNGNFVVSVYFFTKMHSDSSLYRIHRRLLFHYRSFACASSVLRFYWGKISYTVGEHTSSPRSSSSLPLLPSSLLSLSLPGEWTRFL